MKNVTTIRLGICSCSSRYEGRLQGRTFSVNKKRFRIHEVYVFDGTEQVSLKGTRCHFFLNTHFEENTFETDLTQILFVSNGKGRGWKMFQGGTPSSRRFAARYWTTRRPPSTKEILNRGIRPLLEKMDPVQLNKWLAEATPVSCRNNS